MVTNRHHRQSSQSEAIYALMVRLISSAKFSAPKPRLNLKQELVNHAVIHPKLVLLFSISSGVTVCKHCILFLCYALLLRC